MKCETCGFEINLFDPQCGYIKEKDKIYCEKCYANKRFNEIKDKSKWKEQVEINLQQFNDASLNLITDRNTRLFKKAMIQILMRKMPTEWESLIADKDYVNKVREGWKKMGWDV